MVGEHQRARLDGALPSVLVPRHGSRKTRRCRRLTRSEDAARNIVGNPLQKLRLSRRWVANDALVDVPSQVDALVGNLRHAPEDLQQQPCLHKFMLKDIRRDAAGEGR